MEKTFLCRDTSEKGDETYTPFYIVAPLLKYIKRTQIIWCPFDEEWSAFYQLFSEEGYPVFRSSLREGQDFFSFEPEHWDIIVSNPPFSKKDDVLARLYELGKPFAVLLPLTALQGIRRFQYFKQGIQILAFDKRVQYHRNKKLSDFKNNCSFPSAYFCRGILPCSLVLEELTVFERPIFVEPF